MFLEECEPRSDADSVGAAGLAFASIATPQGGFRGCAYAINASQRRKLWATATRSATVVTLTSPRTVNWDTP